MALTENKVEKTSLLNKLLLALNSFAILLLCFSYLSIFVNPNTFWLFSLCGIAYPYILFTNLLFIILWLIIKRKYTLYSLFFIIIGYSQIGKSYQFSGKSRPEKKEDLFKVMSYNVRLFDLYNYNKDWSFNYNGRNKMFQFIRSENPDIACFQEYFHDASNKFCTTDSLKAILKTEHYFSYFPQIIKNTDHYGITIFSRYPIINTGVIDFGNNTNNIAIFADIQKGDKTIRIYNAHLQSIKFGKEDYDVAENPDKNLNPQKNNDVNKTSKKILYKLKQAYLLRASQSEKVAKHISESPYPVILCGDFNDTPTSYAYHKISKNLTDCFVESGSGFGKSYAGKMPSFRIDYIFHDDHFRGYEFTTHETIKASDHYPVTVWLKLKK